MLVFPYFKLTHCDRQRCIRPCGRNHRVAPASRIHGQRHRRGSRAETCGLRCGGQDVRYGVREVIFGVSLQLYQRYAQVDSNDWYIYKIELPMISLLCRRLGPFFLLYVRT